MAVIVVEGGGLDTPTLNTLRALVMADLRKRSLTVVEDVRLQGLHPLGAETRALLGELGARTLALRVVGRLGSKVPLNLEELDADDRVIASVSLTAGALEECDVVLPRLVAALVEQRPVAETARIDTVVTTEARPFQKQPGERFWILGISIPTFSGEGSGGQNGISVGYMYEAKSFGFGIQGLWADNKDAKIGALTMDGLWLPLGGQTSPYLGGGVGHMSTQYSSGMGLKAMAGFEMLLLHRARVRLGAELLLPLFSDSWEEFTVTSYSPYLTSRRTVSGRSNYAVIHLQFAF